MKGSKHIGLIAGLLLLAGCDLRVGEGEGSAADGNVSAAGKSEDGRLSVSAPGFEMNVDIPESISAEAQMDDDSGVIYPNARFSGIHVEGGRDGGHGSDGEVELRFASGDAPDAVARWYADPGRAADFTLASNGREGADFVISGAMKKEKGQFRVRLSPRSGGGTDGQVVLSDRN
jgi:hypothetical protein